MSDKSLEYYLSLDYPYELHRDREEGGYFATHPDLDGCAAQGETADEAIAQLDVARELWIETRLEDRQLVPEPLPQEPSGRVSLRMPSLIHAKLIRIAQRQGVSLNLLLNSILAEYVGGGGFQVNLRDLVAELTAGIARPAPGDDRYDSTPPPVSYLNEPGGHD